jgi:hypothetical protein
MEQNIAAWTKVVTNPLGLTAFALFLVFTFLGSNRRSKKPQWLSAVAFGLAAIALVGGLIVAYLTNKSTGQRPSGQTISSIQQSAVGSSNSNVAGVMGDVSVRVSERVADNRIESSLWTKTLIQLEYFRKFKLPMKWHNRLFLLPLVMRHLLKGHPAAYLGRIAECGPNLFLSH